MPHQQPPRRKSTSVLIGLAALRALKIGALLASIGWLIATQYRPQVRRALVAKDGGTLTILGRGFGRRQRGGYLLLRSGNTEAKLRRVLEWSDRQVVAALPDLGDGGSLHVARRTPFGHWTSAAVPFVVQGSGLPSQPYGYEVPVQAASPWPTFRRDHRNTARSPLPASYQGDRPWAFQTGKGIFSTPVIDETGVIYIGSADHHFYALNPDGSQKWRFRAGEIIDSAAALPAVDPETGEKAVIVPAGDGYLYKLRADDGTLLWAFDARVSPRASYNNWFEGNIAIGYDGTIYAGNTNFNYYAVHPDGSLKWTYETGANNWSQAAFGDDGTIFWASNDTFIRAVQADGREKWRRRTLGFLSASAAIGPDGTVYIGSFDSTFYALDPDSGRVKWRFKTGDHIYGSAALGAEAGGRAGAIFFGSTDGILYALDPDGRLRWRYDTGAPIRSSPVVGRAPDGEECEIVYFGCGNGLLVALNAADGTRRWSYDTTSEDPELRDRNDLNGSPALGKSGVYIGGEHGQVWYVPYDYPLHHPDDPRGCTDPAEDLPAEMAGMLFVTPGGNLALEPPETLPAATIITLRLLVRQHGETIDARLYSAPLGRPRDALVIRAEPSFPFSAEPSADGKYLHIIPQGFLTPDQKYTLHVEGHYYSGGLSIGNLTVGGRRAGRFKEALSFRVAEPVLERFPLRRSAEQVSALEWTRLAVPIPTMMPSLNQIGFDYMDWIMGVASTSEPDAAGRGKLVLWVIGGRRDEQGTLVADPGSDFTLALNGLVERDAFIFTNRDFKMAVTGIPIPFNVFELRGQLGPDGRVRPGATTYAESKVLSIPTFGPLLVIAGLANNWWQKLLTVGTYVTRPYDENGPANRRPPGLTVETLTFEAPTAARYGRVAAALRLERGAHCPLAAHRPGILLIDAARGEAVYLDYHTNLSATADAAGNVSTVELAIPPGTALPPDLKAVVMLDVFPLHEQMLAAQAEI